MGALTPVAIKIGSISWMPRYLPQIVYCDNLVQRLTRQRYGLLDIAGLPNITLRVAGRRSGVVRTTRLLAVPTDDGHRLIAGSYFGGPDMPQWVYNLRAAGAAEMSSHGHSRRMTARELEGDERAAAWERLRSVWPNFDLYVERTDRAIPVFLLEPV